MPLTYFQPSQVDSTFNGYLRNRIINGAMMIDQRNAGASVTLTSGGIYTLDRWQGFEDTDGTMTAQQSSNAPTGFSNSLICTTTVADSSLSSAQYAIIRQPIEGLNVTDLAWGTSSASTISVSFWVRSTLTGTFGGAIQNSAQNRSYAFTYTIIGANTWEYKTVQIPGDTTGTWLTTNGIGLTLVFGLGVGSGFSGTAGSWTGADIRSATGATSVIGTLNATWQITGVQVEDGSVATPFERRMYGTELMLCQRYYETNYPVGVTAGSNISAGYDTSAMIMSSVAVGGTVGTTRTRSQQMPLKVLKRTSSPTVRYFDYVGNVTKFSMLDVNGGNAVNNIAPDLYGGAFSNGTVVWTQTVTGNSAYYYAAAMWEVSSEL